MRAALKISTILVLSAGGLMGASTLSPPQTAAPDNIFNADLKTPPIKIAIEEFEKVCLPFITHETELTPEQDKAVFQSMMTEQGYVFDSEKTSKKISPLKQFPYSPTSCPAPLSTPITDGKYTIFPGQENASNAVSKPFVSNGKSKIVSPEPIMIGGESCETLAVTKMPIRTTHYTRQQFEKINDRAIIASLTWQDIPNDYIEGLSAAQARKFGGTPHTIRLRTSFPPASSCEIHAVAFGLSPQDVTDAVIRHDKDWTKQGDVKDHETGELLTEAHLWQQCTTQNDVHYVYSIGFRNKSVSIKVETLQDDVYAAQHKCRQIETDVK